MYGQTFETSYGLKCLYSALPLDNHLDRYMFLGWKPFSLRILWASLDCFGKSHSKSINEWSQGLVALVLWAVESIIPKDISVTKLESLDSARCVQVRSLLLTLSPPLLGGHCPSLPTPICFPPKYNMWTRIKFSHL